MINLTKTIIHLCASKGSDSLPYKEAGYNVILVTKEIDVRKYMPPNQVYGIIANPPCTDLSGSGARWWKQKGEQALYNALALCDACVRIIWLSKSRGLKFHVLEQPVGRLVNFYGKPTMYFQPNEYGDPYTKKTCLWGEFNKPKKQHVEPTEGSKMWKLPPSENRADLRSECSPGFWKAFFEANP